MKLTRRSLMKAGMAVTAGMPDASPEQVSSSQAAQGPGPSLRERLLLDFGWRFHFGHANDANKDFGFGLGRSGGFQKPGAFLRPAI
jgi:beta-galactosidase